MMREIPASAKGTSALDCFLYHNDGEAREAGLVVGCAAHHDPGLATIAPTSAVQGLEVQDAATEEWVRVEEACREVAGPTVVMFTGKLLGRICKPETASFRPALHRVLCVSGQERLSLLYEARLREADVASWLVAREVAALGL